MGKDQSRPFEGDKATVRVLRFVFGCCWDVLLLVETIISMYIYIYTHVRTYEAALD